MIHTKTLKIPTVGERGNNDDPLRPECSDHTPPMTYHVVEYVDNDAAAIVKLQSADQSELDSCVQTCKQEHDASETTHPDADKSMMRRAEKTDAGWEITESEDSSEIGTLEDNL